MKLQLLSVVLTILVFTACKTETESNSNTFTIKLSIEGIEDSTLVKLTKRVDKETLTIDSIYFSKGAVLTGVQENAIPWVGRVSVDGKRGSAEVVLENGMIDLVAHVDTLYKATVSGTKLNDIQAAYTKLLTSGRLAEIKKKWLIVDDINQQQ